MEFLCLVVPSSALLTTLKLSGVILSPVEEKQRLELPRKSFDLGVALGGAVTSERERASVQSGRLPL